MTSIEQLRESLAAVDPADLTREDRLVMIEVLRQTFRE